MTLVRLELFTDMLSVCLYITPEPRFQMTNLKILIRQFKDTRSCSDDEEGLERALNQFGFSHVSQREIRSQLSQ